MIRPFICCLTLLFTLAACGEDVSRNDPSRILLMGDSLMATHHGSGKAISHSVEQHLGEQVIDRSVLGARMIYALPISGAAGLNIPKQYRPGKWDWVILNGGGNDLWLGCGCFACASKLNRLISEDGRSGVIPGVVAQARQDGAKVLYVGYLRSPGLGSPIENCKDEGQELERRVQALSKLDSGIEFLSLADLVPYGDRSYHAIDMIHPSVKASQEIGKRIADVIGRAPR
ncbi:MAG: SGNH/GDSL hydrolase family protein [Roseovarius sp.]